MGWKSAAVTVSAGPTVTLQGYRMHNHEFRAEQAASSMASPRRTAHRSADQMRVLVVEDENDIAGLVKHTLGRGGDAVVEIASSGDQALKAASEQPPDLIILDLNLPVLGGLEVCR